MDHFRRVCGCDPLVNEFSDLSGSHRAYLEGREDGLLEAPHRGEDEFEIKTSLVFKNVPTFFWCVWGGRTFLQEYVMSRKRPFKAMHSYVERHYIVLDEKPD